MSLRKTETTDIAENEEGYLDRVMANKGGALSQTGTALKLMLGIGSARHKV
jgi:hypothetical protein